MKTRLFLTFLLFSFVPVAAHAAAPKVVVSIKPIHSLVSGVMEGVAVPSLLLHGNTSPHQFSLKPSQARALHEAGLVIWIGRQMESALRRPLASLKNQNKVIELLGVSGLKTLTVRKGGAWAEDEHDEHAAVDPHIWLDPDNARIIVDHVSNALQRGDPANATRYRENAGRIGRRLVSLIRQMEYTFKDVRREPFLVYHDAYQYFESRFSLNGVGSIAAAHQLTPSAKRLSQLRRSLKSLEVRCIFREPQFTAKTITVLAAGNPIKLGILDGIGATLTPGPDAYFEMINKLAGQMTECLQGPS